MYINFIFLLLFLKKFFCYTIREEIRDGIQKTIQFKLTSVDYNFYIWANKTKRVLFNAKTTNGCKLSNVLYIYEYKSTPSSHSSVKTTIINGKEINNVCEYYHSYTILSSSATYVDFRNTVTDWSSKKTNITIRMDLIYEDYDLSNGKPLEIFNLY